MEELIQMAKHFKDAVNRGVALGLNNDELAFYDALANNEESVRELGDATLRKIAFELTDKLRNSITVDWDVRENVRADLRLMVKRILRNRLLKRKKQYSWCWSRRRICAEWA